MEVFKPVLEVFVRRFKYLHSGRMSSGVKSRHFLIFVISLSCVGIGVKISHDDDWIAHQDSFNALLSSLNSGIIYTIQERVSSFFSN